MTDTNKNSVKRAEKSQSQWRYAWRQFKRSKLAMLSACVLILLAIMAIFANFLANNLPIAMKMDGKIFLPILKDYSEPTMNKWLALSIGNQAGQQENYFFRF